MVITALDTHEMVKELTLAGFNGAQAEALTKALRSSAGCRPLEPCD
jgi:hypothetical protein